ncbi:hypothetical protein CHS0354_017607 [Potamilus streckersoni]|uniref:Uncharacterized protein n=1 Tax=Potamilus streckersoni TaxID=2493646 RepID=A0AAE0VHI7_9BIVA|nr:hypothetical protein CHS0354_017607 [Potamilus streckersoni]
MLLESILLIVDARAEPMMKSANANISKPSPCLASEDFSDSCKSLVSHESENDEHKKISEMENSAYAVLTYWKQRKCAAEKLKKAKNVRRALFPIN